MPYWRRTAGAGARKGDGGDPGKSLSIITENQDGFFLIIVNIIIIIIIEKRKPSTGRGCLLCSHLSGLTPGTGCDT